MNAANQLPTSPYMLGLTAILLGILASPSFAAPPNSEQPAATTPADKATGKVEPFKVLGTMTAQGQEIGGTTYCPCDGSKTLAFRRNL